MDSVDTATPTSTCEVVRAEDNRKESREIRNATWSPPPAPEGWKIEDLKELLKKQLFNTGNHHGMPH